MQPKTQTQKKKVLLLHGWDWRKYPKFHEISGIKHQWQNRQVFLDLMKEEFDVDYPALPGFGDNASTPSAESWDLEDYASWLKKRIETHRYDALVGYSFGSAVILKYLVEQGGSLSAVLISPAILRAYKSEATRRTHKQILLVRGKEILKKVSVFIGMKFFDYLRHIYMLYWVRNPLYSEGTPFLQDTYLRIVKRDLSQSLQKFMGQKSNREKISLIFGKQDTETPPEALFSKVPEAKHISILIEDGDHDIGRTHPEVLLSIIKTKITQQ